MRAGWLLLILALGCRTPKKNVSVWSESGGGRGAASRVSEQRPTEALLPPDATHPDVTQTNIGAHRAPLQPNPEPSVVASDCEETPAGDDDPSHRSGALAAQADAPPSETAKLNSKPNPAVSPPARQSIHIPALPGTNSTSPQASALPLSPPRPLAHSSPSVSRPISLSALTGFSSTTKPAPVAPHLPASAAHLTVDSNPSKPLPVAVGDRHRTDPRLPARSVAVPETPDAPLPSKKSPAHAIDVEPALADEAEWRRWHLARQRAAEKSKQAERASLSGAMQQFLERDSK